VNGCFFWSATSLALNAATGASLALASWPGSTQVVMPNRVSSQNTPSALWPAMLIAPRSLPDTA
jgi:hypothetical protein